MSVVSTAPAKQRDTKEAKAKAPNKPPSRLLREREVLARVGLRQTRLKEMVEDGDFPAPVTITPGGRALGYVEAEVDEYIESRIRARDEAVG